MDHWGESPCCTNPPVAKADHHNDTNTPSSTTEPHPHPPNPPRSSGVTNVGPTTAIAEHSLAEPLCPTRVATQLTSAVRQTPTSRRCGHARRRSTPTPRGDAQTTHRAKAIVLCALRRPTCPQSKTIGRHQAGCSHSSANTLGPVHHVARTHQTDDKSKRRKKKGGYISKEFCANADLCPLASPRVALVGVCLLKHPDNGDTR